MCSRMTAKAFCVHKKYGKIKSLKTSLCFDNYILLYSRSKDYYNLRAAVLLKVQGRTRSKLPNVDLFCLSCSVLLSIHLIILVITGDDFGSQGQTSPV